MRKKTNTQDCKDLKLLIAYCRRECEKTNKLYLGLGGSIKILSHINIIKFLTLKSPAGT